MVVQSCCGISLQNGSQIIGWVHMVLAFMAAFYHAVQIDLKAFVAKLPDVLKEDLIQTEMFAIFVLSCIQIVVSVLLVVGVCRSSRGLMMPWIVFTALMSFFVLLLHSEQTGVLAGLALEVYCMLVVGSHWKELGIERMIHIVIVKRTPVMSTPVKRTPVMSTPPVIATEK